MPISANVETGGRYDSAYYEGRLFVIAHDALLADTSSSSPGWTSRPHMTFVASA
jgi:hypothetical protein